MIKLPLKCALKLNEITHIFTVIDLVQNRNQKKRFSGGLWADLNSVWLLLGILYRTENKSKETGQNIDAKG